MRGFCVGTVYFLCGAYPLGQGPESGRIRMPGRPGALLAVLYGGLFDKGPRHAGITVECLRKAYGTAHTCDAARSKRVS